MKILKTLSQYFTTPEKLSSYGILGMNKRNHCYIIPNNPRFLFPRVDNKLITKQLAMKANINIPEMIGVIKYQYEANHFLDIIGNIKDFVIKPTKGSGGRGIMVITNRDGEFFVKSDGEKIDYHRIYQHLTNILSGLYSLGGQPDFALIEKRIRFSSHFEGYSYQGVPDIRVIVYKGYPVMSMMRLSTHASDGRANLHQGAIGLGIDIVTGRAINAIQKGKIITYHPDTGKELKLLSIPNWREILDLTAKCYEITKLGYLGADIVIDDQQRPMLLELNARPGLAIQIANGFGLDQRLQMIDRLVDPEAFPLEATQRVNLILQQLQKE